MYGTRAQELGKTEGAVWGRRRQQQQQQQLPDGGGRMCGWGRPAPGKLCRNLICVQGLHS